jgi:hypothetical protein
MTLTQLGNALIILGARESETAADIAIMRRLDRLHWRSLSPARGCCAGCWPTMGARSAAVT